MTPLALQHGVVICWKFSLDHGKLYIASNCTFNSRLDGIKDLSVPKKAFSAPLHWQQQFGLLTQRRSMETILWTQHKCWFIRKVYLFPVFSCPFLGECGPTRDSNCCFWQMHMETKELFSISKLLHVLGCFSVKSVHLCGHHISQIILLWPIVIWTTLLTV